MLTKLYKTKALKDRRATELELVEEEGKIVREKKKKFGRREVRGRYNKLHSILDQFSKLEQSNTDFARPGSSFTSELPASLNDFEAKSMCCAVLTRTPDRQCSEVASPEKREVKICKMWTSIRTEYSKSSINYESQWSVRKGFEF